MRLTSILFVLVLMTLVLVTSSAWAIRIICPACNTLAELTDTTCKKCGKELNKCLKCGTLNPVSADFCEGEDCAEPLAEMRLLGQIDEETRQELRLGQSERAQLDRELQSIAYLLEKDPSQAKKLLFRQARIYRQMNFPAKEAVAWQEYLQKFPDTKKKPVIDIFLSEALRKWGYLFYMQDDPETALKKYEAAVACNPANAEAWLWVGRIRNEKKDGKGAADAYMKALEAEPGNRTAIHFLRSSKRQIPANLLKAVKKEKKAEPAKDDKPVTAAPAKAAPAKAPAPVKAANPAPVPAAASAPITVVPADANTPTPGN
ncbi:MAG TPA: tetratricopeptide repeat protein [Candidatus Ozemobacteraceae bacterium]